MSEATTLELQAELDATLGKAIEPGTEVAFVNFPNMGNPGDSAIYLGAVASLARIGARIATVCEHRGYRRQHVARAVGDRGTIVINGGGNFGDLYRKQPQQRVRSRLLRDFPRARLIQLPQTIYFQSEKRARRFAARCAAHPDLTIMVRDHPSAERAAALGLETVLCPDAAFGLGPLARSAPPSQPIAWVIRGDVEGAQVAATIDPSARDWPSGAEQRAGETGWRLRRDLALLDGLGRVRDRAPVRLRAPIARLAASRYQPVAARRLALAVGQLSAGEVVVSDRFHGHLLACLLGIPNVLLDNSYGKNRGLFETWTNRYAIARFAEDEESARELAQSLAPENIS